MTLECFNQFLWSHLFSLQLTITAIITMTVFLRTQRDEDLIGANYLLGSLYYTLVRLMTNGVAELIMTITRLPVVDKQTEFYLYPAWAYCLPSAILKIPFSVLDSIVWTSVTYYVIGYSPEITRQVLCLLSCIHKTACFSFTLQVFLISYLMRSGSSASFFCLLLCICHPPPCVVSWLQFSKLMLQLQLLVPWS